MKNTQEKWQELFEHLLTGMTVLDACELAGISRDTFYRWRKNPTFLTELRKAELKNKKFHITNLQNASRQDWKASLAILERLYPEEWGRKNQNITPKSGKRDFLEAFRNLPQENMTDRALNTPEEQSWPNSDMK